ncbi:hypothetical protein DID78_01840 [Candidatus Marinamargulisbacteria bacterium SCGC AG-343-D04]|nr:hypothetical protein DID78_01840 [Candidatus Marinamargulisbacteria bacterium SCGC AG-343-D04]
MPELKKPEIMTYAASKEEISRAVSWGCTHIILDDYAISIRSWSTPKEHDQFESLCSLLRFCKEQHPSIHVSINCDGLIQTRDMALIESLVHCIKELPVDFIRVQDVGLIAYFNEHCSIPVTYCAEMGNANWPSILAFSKQCSRQNLSLDLPQSSILEIQDKVDTDYDIQVQGPVLIQYSHRRFLAGLSSDIDTPERIQQIHRIAEDDDYPGRRFTFLDNHHGHFMFAYFDRCLLMDIPELCQCNCKGWIIDARGESDNYLQTSLTAYSDALEAYFSNPNDYSSSRDIFNTLKACGQRPQKPGFFRANQTDRRRYKKISLISEDRPKVGQVIDIIKGKRISIYCSSSIKNTDTLEALHPKIKSCILPCTRMWTMDNKEITEAKSGDCIQIPWVKGIQQLSSLFLVN